MNMLKIFITIATFVAFYVILELIYRRIQVSHVITRKIAHIVSGGGALALLYFLSTSEFIAVLLFFTAFFGIALLLQLFRSIHSQERKTYGEIMYPIGILIPLLVTHGDYFSMSSAILVLTLSDPVAEIVGRYYGRQNKTIQGSTAFLVSAILILLATTFIYTNILNVTNFFRIIFLALLTTIMEKNLFYGWDNIVIPTSIGIGLYLFF